MKPLFDDQAAKKTTNLSIKSDLLAKSRDMKINLTGVAGVGVEGKNACGSE